MSSDERIAQLEHELAQLRFQVAELQHIVRETQERGATWQNTAREMLDAIKTQERIIDHLGQRVDQLAAGSVAALPTRAILDYYRRNVEPTGKSLLSWLRENGAEHRYRAVVAARNRAGKGGA